MPFPLEDLWGKILRSAAERAWLVITRGFNISGKAEIGKASITFLIQENVFRFEVSVHDIFFMQIAEGQDDLWNEEPDTGLRESSFLTQVVEEGPSSDVFHKEIDPIVVLKDVFHCKNEGMVS